ncbi:hypothetical protein [Prevotellamassilia timonensis]|uniref:hypothetical protein n=1 Tax=Prevotellamassilia timonensis TaxID=1852370 RepID=UPI003FD75FA8
MANENKNNGWGSFIFIIVILFVVCSNIKSCIDDKKEDKSTPVEVTSNSNYYSNNKQNITQSNNTYASQQRTNRMTYSESNSTMNTYNTSPNTASLSDVSGNKYWKEWEDTDVKIYVELEGCESIEEAQEYDLSAIEEDNRYFVSKSISSGTYEVEMGEKVNSRMWKVNHTNIFLKFKFNPWLWRWDKGIIETFGNKGTFYKNPN